MSRNVGTLLERSEKLRDAMVFVERRVGADATAALIAAVPDILDALRELHDFAERSSHYRDAERSSKAFDRAAEILNRFGA